MKIVFVNSFFPPWRGGAETYVSNLSSQLRRRGHEVTVVCGNAPVEAGEHFLNGVRVRRLRIFGRIYGTPVIPELPFKLASENADIIHAGLPSPYNAYFASFVSRLRKIPAVLIWHNDIPAVTRAMHALLFLHDRLVLPSYLPQFRFIIATSELYARISPFLREQRRRVVVIPHGVDTQRFKPEISADEVRSRHGLGESRVVLFVGALTRWHEYKGLDILIEAIAFLSRRPSPPKLLVVGAGDLTAKYVQIAAKLGVAKHAMFAGDVLDRELPEYYAAADVVVLPSKNKCEGFGLAILEANAAGKPAIGTTVGGIPSVIQHGYNGLLVPPNDPKALAEATLRVLKNEDLRQQLGKNGRKLAEQHDWSLVAEQTEKLYRRALA